MKEINEISFTVHTDIRTKSHRIGNNKIYRTKNCRDFEWLVSLMANKAMAGKQKIKGPVSLSMDIYLYSNKNKSKWCTKKPDNTNVLKSVEDAIKDICFEDDMKVVQQFTNKYSAFKPDDERIEIKVIRLD